MSNTTGPFFGKSTNIDTTDLITGREIIPEKNNEEDVESRDD